MQTIVFLLLTASLFAQNARQIKYNQTQFDSDSCCWRKLSREREFDKSANLIVDFIKNGDVENKQSLNWHAGQMFAFAGNDKLALKYFGKTYTAFHKWFGGEDGKAWFFFAKGTSAFIKRDKITLEKIISRWERKIPVDKNLRELKKLLANWDLDYENATSAVTL